MLHPLVHGPRSDHVHQCGSLRSEHRRLGRRTRYRHAGKPRPLSPSLPLCLPPHPSSPRHFPSPSHVSPLCVILFLMGRDQYMFNGAAAFNQNIAGWNVGRVTDMQVSHGPSLPLSLSASRGIRPHHGISHLLRMCRALCVILSFMGRDQFMFLCAAAFDQNIASWNVGSVTTMQVSHRPSLSTLSLLPRASTQMAPLAHPPHRSTSPHIGSLALAPPAATPPHTCPHTHPLGATGHLLRHQ